MTDPAPARLPDTDIAIIGGGLAGLALADAVHRAGADFQLFEARSRLGGRIAALEHGGAGFDLGPAWFWPGQPHMAALTRRFGLCVFEQYAEGDALFQEASGTVHRGTGFASMAGALRIDGGMTALTDALTQCLPSARVHRGAPVVSLTQTGAVGLADGQTCHAGRIVLCLPPRIAASLAFDPPLPPSALRALQDVPTWMAGHAKFVAVYDRPFWRDAGLSGDAVSRRGPLAEIHDASTHGGAPGALFGFVGLPAQQRADRADALATVALAQLGDLFGPQAATPVGTCWRDWAYDPETATPRDQTPLSAHPAYGLPAAARGLWGDRLMFCVTETAPRSGGLMEGALESAARTAAQLLATG